jgi:sterol desaturase/sphingolipid hydroxylase (fatty acid hydroxylase superfamily)
MTVTYAQAVEFAIPVFLTLIAVELTVDRVKGTRYYCLADTINSLSCGIVSTGMRVFFGFFALFIYEWVYLHLAPVHLAVNNVGAWIFAFVVYDLCYYWNHRFGHTVNLFWASHVVHHQSEEFNLTTALRQSGTDSFFGWMFYAPLALCGVPLQMYLLVAVVQLFYQFWPHTRHIGRLGALDRWIQTPSNHRVHHAQNDVYLDKNYVGVFLIWDRLFGSFQEELDEEPCIFGIRGQLQSWNPVWANLHYYWAMAKDMWYTRSWADKVRVWFMNPGWRPADVAARFPKRSYDLGRDFVKFDPPRSASLSAYGLAQFVALAVANSHFLTLLPKQGTALSVLYFAYIVGSLVCLGGVLENRRAFVYAEAVRLTATALAILAVGAWFGGVRDWRVLIPVMAFQVVSLAWLWVAVRARAKSQAAVAAA